jgi:ribonuclease VapC
MITYVFDSSAIIRFTDNEPGAGRVETILTDGIAGRATLVMSAVQWGEFAGNSRKRFGAAGQAQLLSHPALGEIEIVPVTGARAVHAAELKVDRRISYADAFALELALESSAPVLVTADYGFKSVTDLVNIEFLPAK